MTILQAARRYLEQGFSVIPCRVDKRPAGQWQAYTVKSASLREIEYWFDELAYHSIGLVMGRVSQNIIAIDLDGIAAIRRFYQQFSALCETTYSVLTGSQQGLHLYVRVDELPDNINVRLPDVGGFELRGDGQYVIAPPSPHPSGNRYRVHRDRTILHVQNLNDVRDWMLSLRESEQAEDQARMEMSAQPVSVESHHSKQAYLQTVISQELARVSSASEGNRNQSLFYAALRLANLAAGGEVDWFEMQTALQCASQETVPAMHPQEASRTIASAYRIGSKNPRTVT